MGYFCRKLFPACESMCVCCPALRSRSRQPLRRYKPMLAAIFPKSPNGYPIDRKIVKLCEYAAKNPKRIPTIAKYLEDRCYKELKSQHIKVINIVMEVYDKMISVCKGQMAYFATSLLNVTSELLDNSKQDLICVLGCQTLTKFIYSQVDGTYAHNLEYYVIQVCKLAHKTEEEPEKHCLRASSLQCLSAMVWYMTEFSCMFAAFDEIVHATLINYELETPTEGDVERHHNWVDEVVRCEGRSGIGNQTKASDTIIRPRPEKKDPSLLTKEEIEKPRVWAQICIQRIVELAKESSTMRRVLDPMFAYFDSGRHWVPPQGFAMIVLSDMCYFMEISGNRQLILSGLIRHLDHKNVVHDLHVKSNIVQVVAALTRQVRTGGSLTGSGFVSDLCRHLRKSLQATVETAGEQEANMNTSLQNSIEDCLIEIAKGIDDTLPLYDVMAITLENLPSRGVVARATMGSLMILARMISLSRSSSRSQQTLPQSLLVQLLKAMLHPDIESRIGAHRIFSLILVPCSNHYRLELAALQPGYPNEPRRRGSNTTSAYASITSLLEKLRKEKDGGKMENHEDDVVAIKERSTLVKDNPNIYKISSIIDKTAATTGMVEAELYITQLSEDHIEQLLSGFWTQVNLPDNTPSNFEVIGHSLVLTIVSSRLRNPNSNLVVRIFQLLLSLRTMSMDSSDGILPPSSLRSIFVFSTAMIMLAAKIYHINDMLQISLPSDVDPYLGINDDFQLYQKAQVDAEDYGSASDNRIALSVLSDLQIKTNMETNRIIATLVQNLSSIAELEADDVAQQLTETFTPDDASIFGQGSILDLDVNQMTFNFNESLSFDEDITDSLFVGDDAMSEASVKHFVPRVPSSPSSSHIISIGQLMESALEVAGHVAATSVSMSPLSYDTIANQCETLGTDSRKKLSSWLAHENSYSRPADTFSHTYLDGQSCRKIATDVGDTNGSMVKPQEWCLAMRLPPASPFDNFLKAAGC